MFRDSKFSSRTVLLLLAVLLSKTAAAQSLAIHLNGTNKASLEATSPVNVGYRFQASADHENWEDISDQASGSLSYWIDVTRNQKQFFRLRAWTEENASLTLVMLGDSTVADFFDNAEKFYGWGQGMYEYFKPNVQVFNLASPAQSSESFLSSIQRDYLVRIKPDFVLVQFGMMDTWEQEGLYTSIPKYEANLKTIVQIIRDFKGTPVLVTPPIPAYFDVAGRVNPYLEDRSAAVRRVADELHTYVIDLNQLSKDFFNKLGPIESAHITWSDSDRTHFSLAGARAIAGLIVGALPGILHSQVLEKSQPGSPQ